MLRYSRVLNKLKPTQVDAKSKPRVLEDGGGLRLITQGQSSSWQFRYQRDKARHYVCLGSLQNVELKEARAKATILRQQLATGIDVSSKKVKILTFKDAASQYHAKKASEKWSSKHSDIFLSSLTTYAFPKLGKLDITKIDTQDVLSVVNPIFKDKERTALNVRQRIEAVIEYANMLCNREAPNPARWAGHLDKALTKVAVTNSHAAMDWKDLPSFYNELEAIDTNASRCLRWTVLTAARSGEARGMTFAELDMDNHLWTIPASRMKAGRQHIVPLSPTALALVQPRSQSDLSQIVFPGKRGELSNATMNELMNRMGYPMYTVHGFRSSFKDWQGDKSSHPDELGMFALAHVTGSLSDRAYARATKLEKRRPLMADWATFVTMVDQDCLQSTGSFEFVAT